MSARKTAEQKRLTGNPGKRSLPTPISVVPPARLTPSTAPGHLGPAGLRMWEHCRQYAGQWVADSDIEQVRLLCEAMDRRADLMARLANDGYVLFTDKGYAYQHPAAGMLTALEAQITKWLSLLGLTPSDRGRLGVAEVKAQSTLERIRAQRARSVG
ncbi:MAG: phage terminase small subunit P27 family [Chloroflexi bacterium]|nr:phage terminase small subunit P27 family [Chloroflexota bacterium]